MPRKIASIAVSETMLLSMSKKDLQYFLRWNAQKLGMINIEKSWKSDATGMTVYYGSVMTYPFILGMLGTRKFDGEEQGSLPEAG